MCRPGEVRCGDDSHVIEQCAPTGLGWEPAPCGNHQQCDPCVAEPDGECLAACVGPCERVGEDPTSAGCSFVSTTTDESELLFVANPDPSRIATVELRLVPLGSNLEELGEGPLELGPGESHVFELPATISEAQAGSSASTLRSGGIHHLVADLPVSVRRHSPGSADAQRSAASLALPDHMLGAEYMIYGYPPAEVIDENGELRVAPNYFSVIALHDQTNVQWRPTTATAGDGLPLPFVAAGALGTQRLNRFDKLRIAASAKLNTLICERDLSGTIVVADHPIWVESAVASANSSDCSSDTGDLMIEQNIPISAWGTEYIAPHAPTLSDDERNYWRVFAGDEAVTVVVTPESASPPLEFSERGDWVEFSVAADVDLRFTGSGRFIPVQYVGPSMLQMVPTSAYLQRYVFELPSPAEFSSVVSITRRAGAGEVRVDGAAIPSDEWTPIDGWELVRLALDHGVHVIESDEAIGATVYGHTPADPDAALGGAGFACALGLRTQPQADDAP